MSFNFFRAALVKDSTSATLRAAMNAADTHFVCIASVRVKDENGVWRYGHFESRKRWTINELLDPGMFMFLARYISSKIVHFLRGAVGKTWQNC